MKQLFQQALELPPSERETWLAQRCATQPRLREKVQALLAADSNDTGILARPAATLAHHLLGRALAHPSSSPSLSGDGADEEILETGTRIGRHRVLGLLEQGGMGAVYLADRDDGAYQERVALKVLRRGLASPQSVERFRRERQILADLKHPGIARLLDGGVSADGEPYLVMELIEGRPVDQYCSEQGLSIRDRLALLISVCDAVEAAHRRLIVHCDLKPSNILVDASGEPKLLDFGIAYLIAEEDDPSATGPLRWLTPAYASPEQHRGEPPGVASDVYSLGVVLHELLTGERPDTPVARPTAAASRVGSESSVSRPIVSAAAIGRELRAILQRALHFDPASRYGSVAELAADLRRYLQRRPVQALGAGRAYRWRKLLSRHRLASASLLLLLLTLIVGLFATVHQAQLAQDAQRRAERSLDFLLELLAASDPLASEGTPPTLRGLLDSGRRKLQVELGDPTSERASLLETMGEVYRKLGLYSEAEQLLEEGLSIRRQSPGEPALADSLRQLGLLRIRQGQYEEAEGLLREALELREVHRPPQPGKLAASHQDLGYLLKSRGRYEEAERHYRSALAGHLAVHGKTSPRVAEGQTNLGVLLRHMGRLDEAEAMQRQALNLRRQLFGSVHPRTATSAANLALVLRDRGQAEEAEKLLQDSLEQQRATLGDQHPFVAASLSNLASFRLRHGKLDEAESLYLEALAMQRLALGPGHPSIADTLYNLGTLSYRQGDRQLAEQRYRQALTTRLASLGPEHPQVAATQVSLAVVRRAFGAPEEAEELLRQALETYELQLAENHPDTAVPFLELGRLLLGQGRAQEALQPIRRSCQVRRLAGRSAADLARCQSILGHCLGQLGQHEAARSLLAPSLEVLQRELGPEHARTRQAKRFLDELAE